MKISATYCPSLLACRVCGRFAKPPPPPPFHYCLLLLLHSGGGTAKTQLNEELEAGGSPITAWPGRGITRGTARGRDAVTAHGLAKRDAVTAHMEQSAWRRKHLPPQSSRLRQTIAALAAHTEAVFVAKVAPAGSVEL